MAIEIVLDASAVLALLLREPGAEQVLPVVDRAAISAVNHAEVIANLAHRGAYSTETLQLVNSPEFPVVPFTKAIASRAGELMPLTAHHGLSLGDRCCLATALEYHVPTLTANRTWTKLNIAGLTIECIR